MAKRKPRKQRSPYRSLIAIPIQIVIDIVVVALAFQFEIGSRPADVLGHATGAITFMALVFMFFVTLIVAAIALVIMAVRLSDRRREEDDERG